MLKGLSIGEILAYLLVFCSVLAVFRVFVLLSRDVKDAGVMSWLGPRWIKAFREKKRKREFESRILELTMGLANAMKAGMALPQALQKVGEQMGGVMEEELAVTFREYHLGMSVVDAIGRLQERMPCEDMRLLASAVRLTAQTGGSLVDVLSQMVDTIRNRVDFYQKLLSLTAQGRFEAIVMSLVPLIAFVVLYFCQPDLMMPLVTTSVGWCAIAGVLVLEVLGYLTIRKIMSIEV